VGTYSAFAAKSKTEARDRRPAGCVYQSWFQPSQSGQLRGGGIDADTDDLKPSSSCSDHVLRPPNSRVNAVQGDRTTL
jgi:hypothetical protein